MLPATETRFEASALALHREAAALAATAHATARAALARLVLVTNSFYSNLIEGIRTSPAEIGEALRKDFSHDPGRAALQRLAVAHLRVEEAVGLELARDASADVTTPAFLRRLHRDLYADVPDSERFVRSRSGATAIVEPGEFRTRDVVVGEHRPPPPEDLPAFVNRFHEAYRPEAVSEVGRVAAFAASHHRLLWIHPFLDGNGRAARLMSTAYARKIGLDGGGLWSVSRGFARYHAEYYAMLASADGERRDAYDGRGALSESALVAWCEFVVRVSLDQIAYMRSLLAPESLADRLRAYAAFRAAGGSSFGPGARTWRPEAGDLLADLVARGSLPRAAALRALPGKERTRRATLSVLLAEGVLEADHHRAPVRLAFPPHVASILFPDLFTLPVRGAARVPDVAPDPASARLAVPPRSTKTG